MRDVIVHGHIFKNAGSSLDWSLARCFGDAFLDHRDEQIMLDQGAPYLADLLSSSANLLALSSHHLPYPFAEPIPGSGSVNLHPVYLLRHPIDRVASVYAFEQRQQADTRGAQAAKELSFRDYVAWRLRADVPRVIRDYQTCNVSGFHNRSPAIMAPYDWLACAARHLSTLHCVGVVDRYDESMVVFEHYLSEFFPTIDLAYRVQNATASQQPMRDQPLPARVTDVLERLGELAPAVMEANSYDMALYRVANQQLDLALAAIDNFSARLEEFQDRCQSLQRLK